MDPSQLQYNTTILHPAVMVITTLFIIAMLLLPRHLVLVPFLLGSMLIPMQQCLAVFAFDFNVFRLLMLPGMIRAVCSSDFPHDRWRRADTLIVGWVVATVIARLVLWRELGAMIYISGWSYNLLGIYLMGRYYVRSPRDLAVVYSTLIVIMLVLAVFMTIEKLSMYNCFHIFGGLRQEPVMREGALRAQGPFKHPILAGSFGGIFIAAAIAMWYRRHRFIAVLGLIAAGIIVWASASSGPVISAITAVAGMLLWRWRFYMQQLRRVTVVTIVTLHLVMNAPVWALLWRATLIAGSTGYHRYALFDQFMRRIPEWGLCGVRTTANWGYYLFDMTNQYVIIGVNGGLLALLLFLWLCGRCFTSIGYAMWKQPKRQDQLICWSLGVIIFANLSSFFGVGYFDQMMVPWYLVLGIAAGMPQQVNHVGNARQIKGTDNARI